jgi:predicted nucleotidyltransferase
MPLPLHASPYKGEESEGCPHKSLKTLYLFGSWASGGADELSDIDLVIIKRTTKPFCDRLRDVVKLLPSDSGAVDVLVDTPEECARMKANGNAFAEMVDAEGVIL